ncbi:MAG: 4Fe-4S ferredoxin [Azospira oryzae]|nr:MAG: 4Fe-4S ferredoxin [Azospira oryzae]PZP77821.1 MAG: 4Fe-4S ferredoxin [Azospira oryzae]
MPLNDKAIRVCSCNGTMTVDGSSLAKALQLESSLTVHSQLCRRQIGEVEAALRSGRETVVACTQEAPLFTEVAASLDAQVPVRFVNLRETAGWSREGRAAGPKMAALLAAAMVPDPEPVPRVTYKSAGRLLIIGQGAACVGWADRLADQLDVSVLISSVSGGGDLGPERRYPVFSGRVKHIRGYLGAFEVQWEQVNPIDLEVCTRCGACIRACPERAIDFSYQIDLDRCKAHRQCVAACGDIRAVDFERAERDRSETYDLILDLSDPPYFRIPQPPQGYFAPGRDPLDQALAVQQLARMVGEFEKPKFFVYKESICAHGRSKIVGCTKCIDVCSTAAISEEGDYVKVEPHLCMGCGGCATVCPSGAMRYAYPRVADMGARLRAILQTYLRAGGKDPCILFHNPTDGRERLLNLGRRGRGLPARVIPVETFHVASVGLDLMLGSIALGASQVVVLSAGSEAADYVVALRQQMAFGQEILHGLGYAGTHLQVVEAADEEALEEVLWNLPPARSCPPATFNLSDDKRTTLDFAFDHLAKHAPRRASVIALSAGAPYGEVRVDKERCTLCMACVGACPESALLDGKELPQLKFIESNCVQCGLCAKTCPEDAITLAPRLLLSQEAKEPRILNEAEPFHCVKCGKPFATKRMIDNMTAKLGSHSMFSEAGALTRLQMCADCRVIDLMQGEKPVSIFEVTR